MYNIQKVNWQKFRKIIRNCQVIINFCRELQTDITDFYVCWEQNGRGLVQDDIRMQAELEAKKQKEQKEQMPKKIGDLKQEWATQKRVKNTMQDKEK